MTTKTDPYAADCSDEGDPEDADFYECDSCHEMKDELDGEPTVTGPSWGSSDGLPTVICPECDRKAEKAARDIEARSEWLLCVGCAKNLVCVSEGDDTCAACLENV